MKKSLDVSIIIVHYKVKKELFACIQSIVNNTKRITYEIIVVDNDEQKNIQSDLHKKFPNVRYVPNKNNGWGGGINVGAMYATGTFLYFLNPDTIVYGDAIERQYTFVRQQKEVGVVSATLVDENKGNTSHLGSHLLYPRHGIFSLSFIYKLIPNNRISKKFWITKAKDVVPYEVPVVPLAAAIIKKDLFEAIGQFDEKLFMYFEEYDLAMRLYKKNKKNFLHPQANVFHAWGISSKHRNDINSIYRQSMFTYFKKYFGLFPAFCITGINALSRTGVRIALLLLSGFILRIYHIADLMPFIGDQGWFYLSARDMIVSHTIPLVGIASSHPWLHQGASWTYVLALLFSISNFNPVFPAVVTCMLDVCVIYLMYTIGTRVFSQRTGMLAAVFYCFSPIIILFARMPYHTSPIPMLSLLLFYFVYVWTTGKIRVFPVCIFILSLLYTFEIATSVFAIALLVLVGILYVSKRALLQKTWTAATIIQAIIAGSIPLIPMLIYDISHGFPQTMRYAIWIGYKMLSLLHIVPTNNSPVSFIGFITQISPYIKQLIFLPSIVVAWVTFILCFFVLFVIITKEVRLHRFTSSYTFLAVWTGIVLAGVVANKTPSAAYFPMLFPLFGFVIATVFVHVFQYKIGKVITIVCVLLFIVSNTFSLIGNRYLMRKNSGYGLSFATRMQAVHTILSLVGDSAYSLKGEGIGSEFASFTMNYEYLLWYNKHPPTDDVNNIIVVSENNTACSIRQITRPVIAISF